MPPCGRKCFLFKSELELELKLKSDTQRWGFWFNSCINCSYSHVSSQRLECVCLQHLFAVCRRARPSMLFLQLLQLCVERGHLGLVLQTQLWQFGLTGLLFHLNNRRHLLYSTLNLPSVKCSVTVTAENSLYYNNTGDEMVAVVTRMFLFAVSCNQTWLNSNLTFLSLLLCRRHLTWAFTG